MAWFTAVVHAYPKPVEQVSCLDLSFPRVFPLEAERVLSSNCEKRLRKQRKSEKQCDCAKTTRLASNFMTLPPLILFTSDLFGTCGLTPKQEYSPNRSACPSIHFSIIAYPALGCRGVLRPISAILGRRRSPPWSPVYRRASTERQTSS